MSGSLGQRFCGDACTRTHTSILQQPNAGAVKESFRPRSLEWSLPLIFSYHHGRTWYRRRGAAVYGRRYSPSERPVLGVHRSSPCATQDEGTMTELGGFIQLARLIDVDICAPDISPGLTLNEALSPTHISLGRHLLNQSIEQARQLEGVHKPLVPKPNGSSRRSCYTLKCKNQCIDEVEAEESGISAWMIGPSDSDAA